MNKKKAGQAVFIVAAVALLWAGLTYGSGLLFFKLNKMPLNYVGLMTIWDYFAVYKNHPHKFLRVSVQICAFAPYIIALIAGGVIVFTNQKKKTLHGDARFATLAEVRQAGLIDPPKGLEKTILVGKFQNHYLTYGGFQFVMLAAPTRSGKGVGVVIPNCLNYSDSLVVLDIKLENFDITAGYRAKHGQEVYLFSPFDTNGRTHRYNPLAYISDDPASRMGDIDAIAAAFYSGGDEKDKFWNEQAKDLFRGLCLLVLETPDLPNTIGEILRQASGKGKPFKEHIEGMLAAAKEKGFSYSSGCRDSLGRILGNSENTLSSIVATFNTPLLIFQNPRVDQATSANDFDLRDVRRKRMSIYLGVTPDKLKDAAVLINLFFDQLLNLNTRVLPQQDKSLKYQCLMIMDEFTAIGKVNMIQQAISYQAGYNMRVLTIIQNKSQLEDKYGKSGAITLMANHALMIMYAPSPVVQSDANEYSEMLGYETFISKNKSHSYSGIGGNGSRSVSESEQKRALMLPQEIKELGQWREIVSMENCKPILCDKIKYFEDPVFTERINWEAPEIPVHDVNEFIKKFGLGGGSDTSKNDIDVEALMNDMVAKYEEQDREIYHDLFVKPILEKQSQQDLELMNKFNQEETIKSEPESSESDDLAAAASALPAAAETKSEAAPASGTDNDTGAQAAAETESEAAPASGSDNDTESLAAAETESEAPAASGTDNDTEALAAAETESTTAPASDGATGANIKEKVKKPLMDLDNSDEEKHSFSKNFIFVDDTND